MVAAASEAPATAPVKEAAALPAAAAGVVGAALDEAAAAIYSRGTGADYVGAIMSSARLDVRLLCFLSQGFGAVIL